MSTIDPIQLSQSWTAISDNTDAAIEWIEQTRLKSPRLNSEAEHLKLSLYRHKNLANNLSRVAQNSLTLGVFGESQAGKSFLISALAANTDGKLFTQYGDQTLEFIEHINPSGGGAESTALVTRFSRIAPESPDASYPVTLRLFREIELAMILANSWLYDFNHELLNEDPINEGAIHAHLQAFSAIDATRPVQKNVAPEDIVALMDYLGDRRSLNKLKIDFWPTAIRIISALDLEQRAQLLSILWGNNKNITRIYIQLGRSLEDLGSPSYVYAPSATLVQKHDDNRITSAKNSIIDVQTLNLLDTSGDLTIKVRPMTSAELDQPREIKIAQLASLTKELIFKLSDTPQNPIIESIDLLDFPGYRTRPAKDPNEEVKSSDLPELLLRAKVSYLFESYTDSQEMHSLILCASSEKQSEVKEVLPILNKWVYKTQGTTTTERAKRQPTLIWAMTKADIAVQSALDAGPSRYEEHCENLMLKTMLGRFGSSDWMQKWNEQHAFNQAFLIRKPRLSISFLDRTTENEIGINAVFQEPLTALRQTFIQNATIQKHVADPAAAWDAMMTLNDGGVTRLGEALTHIADPVLKRQHLQEQLADTINQLEKDLGQWFHQDADDLEAEKKQRAQVMIASFQGIMPQNGGEFLHLLSLDNDTIHDICLNGSYETSDNEASTQEQPETASLDLGDFADLFGDSSSNSTPKTAPATQKTQRSYEELFATAVYQAWIAHLRDLNTKDSVLYQLDIPNAKEAIHFFIEELITASSRLNLADQIKTRLLARGSGNSRRDQLVSCYVLNTQLVIQDFIAYFGYLHLEPKDRPVYQQKALFDFHTSLSQGELPDLDRESSSPANLYIKNWLAALFFLTLDNIGHSAGHEIPVEQNAQIGRILRTMGVLTS